LAPEDPENEVSQSSVPAENDERGRGVKKSIPDVSRVPADGKKPERKGGQFGKGFKGGRRFADWEWVRNIMDTSTSTRVGNVEQVYGGLEMEKVPQVCGKEKKHKVGGEKRESFPKPGKGRPCGADLRKITTALKGKKP